MIYHVLPGDSLVETFEKTDLEGESIVWEVCEAAAELETRPEEKIVKLSKAAKPVSEKCFKNSAKPKAFTVLPTPR